MSVLFVVSNHPDAVGRLCKSAIKRDSGVREFSGIIESHGGELE